PRIIRLKNFIPGMRLKSSVKSVPVAAYVLPCAGTMPCAITGTVFRLIVSVVKAARFASNSAPRRLSTFHRNTAGIGIYHLPGLVRWFTLSSFQVQQTQDGLLWF